MTNMFKLNMFKLNKYAQDDKPIMQDFIKMVDKIINEKVGPSTDEISDFYYKTLSEKTDILFERRFLC